jgi:hypothetical protein
LSGESPLKTPNNRAVYRENHRHRAKKAIAPLSYAQIVRVFAGFFLAKINRERISKEQGKQAQITGKRLLFSLSAAEPRYQL